MRRQGVLIVLALLTITLAATSAGFHPGAAAATGQEETTVLQTSAETVPAIPQAPRVKELTGLRTEISKTYELSDGNRELVCYGEAVNYKDANGVFQEIDDSIVNDSKQINGSTYNYRNGANAFTAWFGANASDTGLVKMEYQGTSIAFGPVGAKASASVKTADVKSQTLSDMTYGENLVSYPGVFPGVDLFYEIKTYGIKEYLTLRQPGAKNEFTFNLVLNGLTPSKADDGRIILVNAKGETLFWLGEPLAVDSAGVVTNDVNYTISGSDGSYELRVTVPASYLADTARVYPVIVDPDLLISGSGVTYDTYVSSRYPSTNYNVSPYYLYLRTGHDDTYYTRRSYLKFDLSAASGIDPDTIDSAYIRLERYTQGYNVQPNNGPHVNAYRSKGSWSSSTVTWNTYTFNSTNFDTSLPSTEAALDTGNWWKMYCTTPVKGWLKGSYNNYGWLVKDNTDDDWSTWYASDSAYPHKPELHITYTTQSVSSEKYMASMHFEPSGTNFPIKNSSGKLFYQLDYNGDGLLDGEDALESIVLHKIGTSVTGTSRIGLPIVSSTANNQAPAVYFKYVPNPGPGYVGWGVWEYWLYYADNYDVTYGSYHEHDWERYYVYENDQGLPKWVMASVHQFVFGYYWNDFESIGETSGTHLLLSASADGHGIWAPSGGMATGVEITWSGSVIRHSGTLSQGDGTSPGWTHFCTQSEVSPRTSFTLYPDAYYYGDPFYGSSEYGSLNWAPWNRATWDFPVAPYTLAFPSTD